MKNRLMSAAAISPGLHHSEIWQRDYPKLQIRTIEALLEGKGFDIPYHPSMYQPSSRLRRSEGEQARLDDAATG